MPSLMPTGKQQYFYPNSNLPLVGGQVFTYGSGTSNPKATFADAAGVTPNANPITLDSSGSALIFWSGSYKVVIKDAIGNTIYTVDNYVSDFAGSIAGPGGAALVGFQQAGIAAAMRTVQDKLRETASPADFGAVGDGVADDTAAIQSALASGKVVLIDQLHLTSGNQVPSGTHIIFRNRGKLKLANGANRPILQNTNWQKAGWGASAYGLDADITIDGLNIDGNQANQSHTGTGVYAGEYTAGVRFFGVTNLTLRRSRVYQACTFSVWLCAIDGGVVDDLFLNQYMGGAPANQDGLHINGPARNMQITNVRGTTNDDMIALNADDGALGANVSAGPISNMIIDGVTMIGCLNGIRVLSAVSRIDQIAIKNITGSTRDIAVNCSPYGLGVGNIGSVTIDGVDVQCSNGFAGPDYFGIIGLDGIIQSIAIRNIKKSNSADTRPAVFVTSGGNIGVLSIDGLDAFSTTGAPANEQCVQIRGMVDTLSVTGVRWFRDSGLSQNGSVIYVNGADATKGVMNLICADWEMERLSDVITLTGGYLRVATLNNIIHKNGLAGTALVNLASASSALSTAVSIGMIREELGRKIVNVSGVSVLSPGSVIDACGLSGCEVTLSAAQAIPAAAYTKLALNTLSYDRIGEFDVANKRFTASQAPGSYLLEYQIQATIPTAATNITIALYRNGVVSRYLPGSQVFGTDAIIGGSTRITVATGDYFEIFVFASNAITVQAGTSGTVVSFERLK